MFSPWFHRTSRLRHVKAPLFAAVLSVAVAGCVPTVSTHGNLLSESRIAQVSPGQSSRADVTVAWGPPTTVAPLDNNIWYYIGETKEQRGIYEPITVRRQIIRVTFGEDDMIDEIAEINPEDGREIAFVTRRTSTAGKEFTVLQQLIGNLGKFNQAQPQAPRR